MPHGSNSKYAKVLFIVKTHFSFFLPIIRTEGFMKKCLLLLVLVGLAVFRLCPENGRGSDRPRRFAQGQWITPRSIGLRKALTSIRTITKANGKPATSSPGGRQTSGKGKSPERSRFSESQRTLQKGDRLDPKGYEGHLRLSGPGRLALFRGGKGKNKPVKAIKAEVDIGGRLEPNSDIAYHVPPAGWHQNLANLSGVLRFFAKVLYGGAPPGSNDEAVAMFKKPSKSTRTTPGAY